MTALIRAELLKLRTRSATGLLLATLTLVTLTVATSVPKAGTARGPVSLHDPGVLAGVVGIGFAVPVVFVVLLGGLAFTQEFRYGTATATYLGEPRRSRILFAKWLSLALASTIISVATLVVSVPLGVTVITARGGEVSLAPQLWQTIGAGFVVMAAYAVIGVAVGALVRNQVVAVVGVLVWMLVVEQIVIPAYPVAGRWLPGGATDAWLQLGPVLDLDDRLLPAPLGGLLLLVYTAAAVALASKLTLRRDVL
ncbi:MAG TPA: ABC transporter permease [Frankiaceae bacterium]|nr:ABC transporter permease [Frankiaceae bacterium]